VICSFFGYISLDGEEISWTLEVLPWKESLVMVFPFRLGQRYGFGSSMIAVPTHR
jgi:hypothetical protein